MRRAARKVVIINYKVVFAHLPEYVINIISPVPECSILRCNQRHVAPPQRLPNDSSCIVPWVAGGVSQVHAYSSLFLPPTTPGNTFMSSIRRRALKIAGRPSPGYRMLLEAATLYQRGGASTGGAGSHFILLRPLSQVVVTLLCAASRIYLVLSYSCITCVVYIHCCPL